MNKLYIFIVSLLFTLYSNASTSIQLKSGWNLVGVNDIVSLDEIKKQVNTDNLLNIQGDGTTYQKAYVDAGYSNLNNFQQFEPGKGFWLRVQEPATLQYNEKKFTGQVIKNLKAGWNLISPLKELTLLQIKEKVGETNLLNIQGDGTTYQKAYVDAGYSNLNNFEKFELSKGYWIRVQNSIDLLYEFINDLTIPAINNSGNNLEYEISTDMIVKVFSSNELTGTSQSTNAITGSINNISLDSELQLNSNYDTDSKFQVKVFDSNDNLIGQSTILDYNNIIDFGTINTNSDIDTPVLETALSGNEIYISDNQGTYLGKFNSDGTYEEYTKDDGQVAETMTGTWQVIDTYTVELNIDGTTDVIKLEFSSTNITADTTTVDVYINSSHDGTSTITEFETIGNTTGSTDNTGGSTTDSSMTPPNPSDDGSLDNSSIPTPPQIPSI